MRASDIGLLNRGPGMVALVFTLACHKYSQISLLRQRDRNQRMNLVGWQKLKTCFEVREMGETGNRMKISGLQGEIEKRSEIGEIE